MEPKCYRCRYYREYKKEGLMERKYKKYFEFAAWIAGTIVLILAFYGMITSLGK